MNYDVKISGARIGTLLTTQRPANHYNVTFRQGLGIDGLCNGAVNVMIDYGSNLTSLSYTSLSLLPWYNVCHQTGFVNVSVFVMSI